MRSAIGALFDWIYLTLDAHELVRGIRFNNRSSEVPALGKLIYRVDFKPSSERLVGILIPGDLRSCVSYAGKMNEAAMGELRSHLADFVKSGKRARADPITASSINASKILNSSITAAKIGTDAIMAISTAIPKDTFDDPMFPGDLDNLMPDPLAEPKPTLPSAPIKKRKEKEPDYPTWGTW